MVADVKGNITIKPRRPDASLSSATQAMSPPPGVQKADGPFSTGTLIAIVLVGAGTLAAALALFFVWLSRRRGGAAHLHGRNRSVGNDNCYYDGSEGVIYVGSGGWHDTDTTTSSSTRPKKLYKKAGSSTTMTTMTSHSPGEMSPEVGTASVPVLPPLSFRRSSLMGSTLTGRDLAPLSSAPPDRVKRSSAWVRKTFRIDGDGLHGPKVATRQQNQQQKDASGKGETGEESTWRFGRDSWPLKNMVPTLPRLSVGPGANTGVGQPPTQEVDAGRIQMQQVRPTSLVQPPGQVVITADGWQPASSGMPGPYYAPEDIVNVGPVKASPRYSAASQQARMRHMSTESTLSDILRCAEVRLQEGEMTGVAKRNLRAWSPSKTPQSSRETLVAKPSYATIDGSTICQSCSQSFTESPIKLVPSQLGSAAQHRRQVSGSSVISEPDSLCDGGDVAPPSYDVPHGLTSPSRTKRMRELERLRAAAQSPCSSVSSALSTLYSEDEPQDGPPTEEKSGEKTDEAMNASAGDPFTSGSPSRSLPKNQQLTRFRQRQEKPPLFNLGVRTLSSSAVDKQPHSTEQGTLVKQDSPQRGLLFAPTLTAAAWPSKAFHPQVVAAMCPAPEQPAVVITSPSYASLGTPSLSGLSYLQETSQDERVVGKEGTPPHKLRAQASSPTLGNHFGGPDPDAPPLPLLSAALRSNLQAGRAAMSPSPLAGGSPIVRMLSNSSGSAYSQDTNDERSDHGTQAASSDSHRDETRSDTMIGRPLSNAGLAGTVALLRRMNSTTSAYSTASGHSAGGGGESDGSPTLPILRGGGFSPAQRRGGTHYYLGLGAHATKFGQRPPSSLGRGASQRMSIRAVGGDASGAPQLSEEDEEMGEDERTKGIVSVGDTGGSGGSKVTTPSKPVSSALERLGGTDLNSRDSLGLYDKDGFLISSPVREAQSSARTSMVQVGASD
ncbi:hypothetical protein VTK73DRAFT_6039 [Phialemonium thermophilum]|uniref:Uncharacterized protein n=1 Tax=Phialemonium thermophilum TaxID=223376 RepID=A0ABR3XX43_9PEZI